MKSTQHYKVHFYLQELLSAHVRKDVWESALEYLKQTNDANGWRVMLYGA